MKTKFKQNEHQNRKFCKMINQCWGGKKNTSSRSIIKSVIIKVRIWHNWKSAWGGRPPNISDQGAKENSEEAEGIHSSDGRSCSHVNHSPHRLHKTGPYRRVARHMKSHLKFAKRYVWHSTSVEKVLCSNELFGLDTKCITTFGTNPTLRMNPIPTVKHGGGNIMLSTTIGIQVASLTNAWAEWWLCDSFLILNQNS